LGEISEEEIQQLHKIFSPLVGVKIDWLSIPGEGLKSFEPSQIAVIVNTLLDGILPQIELLSTDSANAKKLKKIGLKKAPGLLGEREGYPDYIHVSGKRVELKGLFVDNPKLKLKRPPTKREPSARLKENITTDDVNPEKDVLLIAAVQLKEKEGKCSPFIVDIGLFSMIECIKARDARLYAGEGKWFGKVPKVVSLSGLEKIKKGKTLTDADYEKDTNFGKMKRIPYPPLQQFLRKWTELDSEQMHLN
jgi:hypothetical protein